MDSGHSTNSSIRDLNRYPAKIYPFSESGAIRLRRYGFALLAVLILHLAVFFGFGSLLDSTGISLNHLSNLNSIEVELLPERYAEVNPEAVANRPDHSAFYSFQDQQAADLSPDKDGSARPQLDGSIEDSIKIVSGSLAETDLTQPLSPGIYMPSKEISAPSQGANAQGADQSAAVSASMAISGDSLHPFDRVISEVGVDTVPTSRLDSPEQSVAGTELVPLTLATAEALSGALEVNQELDSQSTPVRPIPMKRPKLSSELTIGPIAQTRASANQLGVIAMDAALSEFGEYEKQFYSAVQNGWYNEIDFHQPMESNSRVIVSFVLNSNGTIDAVTVLSSTAGAMATRICESAIVRRSPFRAWTRDMVEVYGQSRELTLRFYYR